MPGPFDPLFQTYTAAYNLPAGLLAALSTTESSQDPNSVTPETNNRFSYGLFNILDSTARGLGFTGDFSGLLDPETNTALAAQYASQIIQNQGGFDPSNFYSEWNSGRALAWKTSSQVAQHVANFLINLKAAVLDSPAAEGVGSLALIVLAAWWWLRATA